MTVHFDPWYEFRELVKIIKHESRFVLAEPYKSLVDSIVKKVQEQFSSTISANSILYRARINKINFEKKEDEKNPFSPEEMGPPPKHLAISGRINPEGITYLYCSGELDTAGAELRPWKGAYLTIGEVKIKRNIPIVDLTLECNENEDVFWRFFFSEFADVFSIQWPPDLKLNYLSTQFFSENFKAAGFRGIKYKSAFNLGGNNFSLFYEEDYEILKTYSIETCEIDYFFYEHRSDRP